VTQAVVQPDVTVADASVAATTEPTVQPVVTTTVTPPVAAAITVDEPVADPGKTYTLPDGSTMSAAELAEASRWEGVLCVEGITTGDGREFAPDALTWADHALLRWQKEGSHGGNHDVTVSVGRIDETWRSGNMIMGRGELDLLSADGFEIWRRLSNDFAGGISIDADDISDADVEFVWPDDPDKTEDDSDEDIIMMLFAAPEKMIFHGGRVRAATLCDIPAFVEARIGLSSRVEAGEVSFGVTETSHYGVVATHVTETSDEPWVLLTNLKRLTAQVSVATARRAFAYLREPAGEKFTRTDGLFLHHEVSDDGQVGAANLTACARWISTLNGDHLELDDESRRGAYRHLAQHLRDAGKEAPPLVLDDQDAVTASVALVETLPSAAWFADPKLSIATGITITDQGRIYGHAAQWGECHIGFADECVTVPIEDAHPYFMTGEVVCDDGTRVGVGQITVGTGHAPLSYRAQRAVEHYDNTGAAVADVAVGNDRHGIWVAGAIRPNATAARVHELRASGQVSGDWRRIGGQLRLVGLLGVNVPGFPVPRQRARVAGGAPVALIAAGQTTVGRLPVAEPDAPLNDDQLDQKAMRRVMTILARRVLSTTRGGDHSGL
jgi:hypothetical protein